MVELLKANERPIVYRTTAMPIRFVHAKTARKIALTVDSNTRREVRRRIKQAVKIVFRTELLKIRDLIRDKYLSSELYIIYTAAPTGLRIDEAKELYHQLQIRLEKYGYVIYPDEDMLMIKW